MKHTLKIYKMSQRSLNPTVVKKDIERGVSRALAGGRGRSWGLFEARTERTDQDGEYLYTVHITFERTGKATDEANEHRQFVRIQEIVEAAVRGRGWSMNGESPSRKKAQAEASSHEQHDYAEVKINTDPSGYFDHLYNLDSQIDLVLSAVEEYQRSEFNNRFHCVLYGEPACGKTEILRSLGKMLGPDAVMNFDATSTTAAGAKQLLTEASHIPPVLCIEEIEKADEQSLRWLLGVLDYRAEVRALKFRAGLNVREVKLLCLATVNDFGLFNKMMDGALASRFSHKIYCPRPTANTLEKILTREVTKAGGDPRWIKPALEYCTTIEKTNDPRRIITVCLCGKDRLLTGEYQRVLTATRPTNKVE